MCMAYCQLVLKKCQPHICLSKQLLTVHVLHAYRAFRESEREREREPEREPESVCKSLAGCCLAVAFVSFCSTLLLSTLQDSDHIQTSLCTQIVPFLEGRLEETLAIADKRTCK